MVTSPSTWRMLNLSYPSPFMNLAFDEAMAQAFSAQLQTQPTLRIWINGRSVILGRFQEAHAEVDLEACHSNDVEVVRRFTGGGTVFHDKSTLNLTITAPPPHGQAILAFQENNLKLISKALSDLGLGVNVEPPNSILFEGRKVCGAAAATGKHFTLWHCTILVDTDLQLLELTLSPSKSQHASRFVHSKWKPVTTIAHAISSPVRVDEVADALSEAVEAELEVELEPSRPSSDELRAAQSLFLQKYSLQEWNMRGNWPLPPRLERREQLHNYGGVSPLHAFS